MAHNLWSVCLSESKQIYLLPITVSLSYLFIYLFLQWDIENLRFIRSWNQGKT